MPKESWLRSRLFNKFLETFFPDPIDRFLRDFFLNNQKIKFIEVGANDGITWDPLFKFVKKFKWEAILIEPHPAYYKELTENYKNINPGKIHFENVAISIRAETREMF